MKVLSDDFKQQVVEIMHLSKKVNGNDSSKILDMICKHAEEISQLYSQNDNHWRMETADLLVLCCELLLMHNQNVDDIVTRCLPRFYNKLHRIDKGVENV